MTEDSDTLDGCDLDFTVEDQITDDDAVAALVLFADTEFDSPVAVQARAQEWQELFS